MQTGHTREHSTDPLGKLAPVPLLLARETKLRELDIYAAPLPVRAPLGFSFVRSADSPAWSPVGIQRIADALFILRESLQGSLHQPISEMLSNTPIDMMPPEFRSVALWDTLNHRLLLSEMSNPFQLLGTLVHEGDHGTHDRTPSTVLHERIAREDRSHRNTEVVLGQVRSWIVARDEPQATLKDCWIKGIDLAIQAQRFGLAEWHAFRDIVVPLTQIAHVLAPRPQGAGYDKVLATGQAVGRAFLDTTEGTPLLHHLIRPLLDGVVPLVIGNAVLGVRLQLWERQLSSLVSSFDELQAAGRAISKCLNTYQVPAF